MARRGLRNFNGNACWLNSLLQSLLGPRQWQDAVLRHMRSRLVVPTAPKSAAAVATATSLLALQTLRKLVAADGAGGAGQPESAQQLYDLLTRAGPAAIPGFASGVQQDCHEALSALLPRLVAAKGVFGTAFAGAEMRQHSVLTCTLCGHSSSKTEPDTTWTLALKAGNRRSLLESLVSDFAAGEQLPAKRCPDGGCGKSGGVVRRLTIPRAPEVLIVLLRRVGYDAKGGASRLQNSVRLPLSLKHVTVEEGAPEFRLTSVVYHRGNSHKAGHYNAAGANLILICFVRVCREPLLLLLVLLPRPSLTNALYAARGGLQCAFLGRTTLSFTTTATCPRS
jgi:ubiquitin C-terminal hydrolase